jgi:hypothetical protein
MEDLFLPVILFDNLVEGEYYYKVLREHGMVFKVMDKNIVDDIWIDRCASSAC